MPCQGLLKGNMKLTFFKLAWKPTNWQQTKPHNYLNNLWIVKELFLPPQMSKRKVFFMVIRGHVFNGDNFTHLLQSKALKKMGEMVPIKSLVLNNNKKKSSFYLTCGMRIFPWLSFIIQWRKINLLPFCYLVRSQYTHVPHGKQLLGDPTLRR